MHAGGERLEHRGALHVHRFRHQPGVGDRRDAELGKRPAKARRRVAIVEAPGGARGAAPALPEWIERHVIAHLEAAHPRTDVDYFAGRLMAEYRWQVSNGALGAEFPLIDVKVGAADAAGGDLDQQFALARTGHRRFDKFDAGCGPGLGNRFHQFTSVVSLNTTRCLPPSKARRKKKYSRADSRVHVRGRLRSNDASALLD